jgi:hypothetical protein
VLAAAGLLDGRRATTHWNWCTALAEQFPFLRLTEQIRTDPQFFETMELFSRRLFFPACLLIAGGVFGFGIYRTPLTPVANITPAGAVDYIQREHLAGNIYNPHNFGGYLIFRGVKTFIDGRTDQLFYQDNFITHLHDIIDQHPQLLPSYLNEYRIGIALVEPDSIEAQELDRSDNWEKIYSDDVSELFQNSKQSP